MPDLRTTTCRKCSAMFPIVVTVEDGTAIKVEGDREAPVYGGFTCPKGHALTKEQAALNRLTHRLMRMPDGSFDPISSDELVEEISAKLADILDRYGEIVGFVQPDIDIRQGVGAMANGFGARYGRDYDPEVDDSNVKALLSWDDDFDPYHGMPRMSAVPISVSASLVSA